MNPAASGAHDPFTDGSFPSAPVPQANNGYTPVYGGGTPYGNFGTPYNNTYMPSGFNSAMYGTGHYGSGYAAGAGRYGAMLAGAQTAHDGGAAVLSGMQEAMQRFARVSAMMEEMLRNLHMLFDGLFGLGYSIGAFHQEASRWLAVKSGPVALLKRVVAHIARLWRLIALFLCSPMAGRFSPVALVLRILGVVPEYSLLEESDSFARSETHEAERISANRNMTSLHEEALPWPRGDGPNL
jgi:hypothetical protein